MKIEPSAPETFWPLHGVATNLRDCRNFSEMIQMSEPLSIKAEVQNPFTQTSTKLPRKGKEKDEKLLEATRRPWAAFTSFPRYERLVRDVENLIDTVGVHVSDSLNGFSFFPTNHTVLEHLK